MSQEWYDVYYEQAEDYKHAQGWNVAIVDVVQQLRERHSDTAACIVDLGCGQGYVLMQLMRSGAFVPDNIYGVEQSTVATRYLEAAGCQVVHTDLQRTLPFDDAMFDYVVVAEVVEHLLRPISFLREVRRILKPGGHLVLSFPNYLNLPWFLVRLAAEWFNQPQIINLQPIDRILFYPQLKRLVEDQGLSLSFARGTYYFPPLPHGRVIEPSWFTRWANRVGMAPLSFHPVMVFRG